MRFCSQSRQPEGRASGEQHAPIPVNRQRGSGLQAIADAVMEIQTGFADVVVAAGAESISQLPYYVKDARWGARMGHKVFEDGVIDILTWPLGPYHNGAPTAENVAEKYNVTRQEQDQYALESHLRAAGAIEAGKFKEDEILPVELKDRKGNITVFDTDEGPRASQTIEKLERLKPCFVKGGTVTAGNSSSLERRRCRCGCHVQGKGRLPWASSLSLPLKAARLPATTEPSWDTPPSSPAKSWSRTGIGP